MSSRMRLADDRCVRNEYFEAEVDPVTGGLKRISDQKYRLPRLGQQIVYNPGSVPKVKQITLRRPRRLWRKPQTSPGFSTSPSFIDVGFARMASDRMQAELDPEKQFYKGRNPELIAAVRPYLLYYHGGRFARPLIADTGRAWREQRGIRKIRQGARTVWSSPRSRDGTA